MQQSIVKFIPLSYRHCSTCFGALQCPSSGARQTAVAASGFRMNVEVEVFSAVVGLLTNRRRLRTPEETCGKAYPQCRKCKKGLLNPLKHIGFHIGHDLLKLKQIGT